MPGDPPEYFFDRYIYTIPDSKYNMYFFAGGLIQIQIHGHGFEVPKLVLSLSSNIVVTQCLTFLVREMPGPPEIVTQIHNKTHIDIGTQVYSVACSSNLEKKT